MTESANAHPSQKVLAENRVASRLYAKDASLYSFSALAEEQAASFMGWTDLASKPPCSLADIADLAQSFIDRGFKLVILIGQGGCVQAVRAMAKYVSGDHGGVDFRVLDSVSPVRLRGILAGVDPRTTLVVVSSKSGDTLEATSMLAAVNEAFSAVLSADELPLHLVGITDPGSALAERAQDEGWAGLLLGEPSVDERFSALSVYGLFPAALVGIDLEQLVSSAAEMEKACRQDDVDNPAIQLAAFLYDSWRDGRDKMAFLTQKSGRALGLWVEQLVAGSTGKDGKGLLCQLEVDPLLLRRDAGDRMAVTCCAHVNAWDDFKEFQMAASCVGQGVPLLSYEIESVYELVKHFVMWEYAIAMCAHLMQVNPFGAPDAAPGKAKVLAMLQDGLPKPDFVEEMVVGSIAGDVEAHLSDCCAGAADIRAALRALLGSLGVGDYFAINAFVPFSGEGRYEALEAMRHEVASRRGVVSCLEIGPQYLHSAGQLQKGGSNTGVCLVISADELKDIGIPNSQAPTLGQLAKAQAAADMALLAERSRRCLHLHLPNHAGITLRCLANIIAQVLDDIQSDVG